VIHLLRYGVILLGTVVVALLLFIVAAYSSKSTVFSANTWTPEVIRAIMVVGVILGGTIGVIDYAIFDPVTGTVTITSSGIMLVGDVEFEIYWDVTGTSEVTMVEWGDLMPGDVATVEFWVKNEGNSNLYCDTGTDEWVPSGSDQYFDLTWDFGDTPVGPGRSRKVTMELHVHSDITGIDEFTFNIIIYGDIAPFS
jgi:hypothetical protein